MPISNEEITPDGVVKSVSPQGESTSHTPVKQETAPETQKVESNKPENVVDFSSFEALKQGAEEGSSKKEESKKEEQKVEPPGRDLAGIDPSDAPLFTRMSNEAFNRLKPLYLDYKKQQESIAERDKKLADLQANKIPESYYEHPEAVMLTPEYRELNNKISVGEAARGHWERQLQLVAEGAEEYSMLDTDAQGNLVIAGKVKAGPTTREELLRRITRCDQFVDNQRVEMDRLSSSYGSKVAESSKWIKEHEEKVFPIFTKPEGEKFKPIVTEVINNFPAPYRKNPLAGFVAKSLITMQQMAKMIEELKKGNGKVELSAEKKAAGPGSSDTVVETTKKAEVKVDFNDFNKVKEMV